MIYALSVLVGVMFAVSFLDFLMDRENLPGIIYTLIFIALLAGWLYITPFNGDSNGCVQSAAWCDDANDR